MIALDALLAELERKKLKRTERPQKKPRETKTDPKTSPHIPDAVRREVNERDGQQCTYVDEHGVRCEARAFLELDHVTPRALGGKNIASELRVRCRQHNRLEAELIFGKKHIEERINLRQRNSKRRPSSENLLLP